MTGSLSSPALIIGDDPVNVLGVARNLGRLGVPVHRIGESNSQVLKSRYIKSVWTSNLIEDYSDEQYVELIQDAYARIGANFVLFPLSDIHVLRVSRVREIISEWCVPLAARPAVAEILVNKRHFYEALVEFDMPHPRSLFPQSEKSFFEAAEEIGYPVFLKPENSPGFAKRFRQKGFVANDPDELAAYLGKLDQSGLNIMVQDIIPGNAACMHGCAGFRTPSQLLTFCYRRIREYPPKFGCGSLIESIPDFSKETRLAEFLESIDYEGLFDAEFKLDPRDNTFKAIEINARSWWQNLHPSASGINLIQAAYDHAVGRQVQCSEYRTGIKWMHLYNDYSARVQLGIGLISWLKSVKSAAVFDIYSKDDVWPAIVHFWSLGSQKLMKILRR